MNELQNGFYNAVAARLPLQAGTGFQLFSGFPPLASGPQADSLLWNYFNNIPPYSLTQPIVESGGNQFFSNYKGLLSALRGSGGAFQQDIGADCYGAWQQYLGASSNSSVGQLPNIFLNWATQNFPSVAKIGGADLSTMLDDPVATAQLALMLYVNRPPDWSAGYSALAKSLAEAPPLSFTTSDWNSDVSNSWTGGINIAAPRYLAESSTAQLKQFVAAGVTLEASFAHIVNFAAKPGGWYTPSAMALAYTNPSGEPWSPSSPINWLNTFGTSGNLRYFMASLIVVDTMNVVFSSSANFNQRDQNLLESNSGRLTFSGTSNSAVLSNTTDFTPQGSMIAIKSQPGVPILIGGMVLSTAQYIDL